MMNINVQKEPRPPIRLMVGLCLATFAGCLDFTIVNTALPAIQQQFHTDLDGVQWAMTLFVMALCCCMVLASRLAERFGKTTVLYAGMLLFALASLIAGMAVSLSMLLLGRFLQGIAGAVLYTTTAAVLVDAVPESRQGRALGWLFAANGTGLALGPVAGGLLVSEMGWRAIFLINIPLMILSYAGLWRKIPAQCKSTAKRLDVVGWLLLVVSLLPLLMWAALSAHWGSTRLYSFLLLPVSAVLLVCFVRYERRVKEPLISVDVLGEPLFRRACCLSVLLAIFYCSAFLLIPFKLLAIYSLTASGLGLMLLPVTLVMALTSPVAGRCCDRFGAWPVLMAGFSMLALSAAMQSVFAAAPSRLWVIVAFMLMGTGWGAVLSSSVTASLAALPTGLQDQGIGISWTLHNLGGVLGLTVTTQVYHYNGAINSYSWVMGILTGLSLFGVGIAFLTWRSIRQKMADAAGGKR